MIDVLAQDPGQTGSILNRKIANNTKINHLMVYFTDHYNDIDLDRLPPQNLKLEMINGTLIILFYVSPSFPQQQRILFSYYNHRKPPILQQLTGGNTSILVLKRMLGVFLKILPLKNIS